jgi:hypothetical protein
MLTKNLYKISEEGIKNEEMCIDSCGAGRSDCRDG